MLLSIVIPVYNEVHTLGKIIALASSVLPEVGKEIIVVDDGSGDGTREWLIANFPEGPRSGAMILVRADGNLDFVSGAGDKVTVRPIYHETNKGKGCGLRTGFAAV